MLRLLIFEEFQVIEHLLGRTSSSGLLSEMGYSENLESMQSDTGHQTWSHVHRQGQPRLENSKAFSQPNQHFPEE